MMLSILTRAVSPGVSLATSRPAGPVNPATAPTLLDAPTADVLREFPQNWPGHMEVLRWAADMNPGVAALLLVAGIVYLLWGESQHKLLMSLNAAVAGAWLGAVSGSHFDAAVPAAFVFGFTFGAMTWPMMKYAVALSGGIFGFIVGMSVWRGIGLDPAFAPAGGATGLVFFGMLSFIVFRTSVIIFTSVQGSAMLIFGVLGLCYKSQEFAPLVTQAMTVRSFMIPLAIFIPAVVGLIYQHHADTQQAPAKK
ncbi:MAG: hypothetical protein ACFCVE_14925 [Phycisphaerae bacterium]